MTMLQLKISSNFFIPMKPQLSHVILQQAKTCLFKRLCFPSNKHKMHSSKYSYTTIGTMYYIVLCYYISLLGGYILRINPKFLHKKQNFSIICKNMMISYCFNLHIVNSNIIWFKIFFLCGSCCYWEPCNCQGSEPPEGAPGICCCWFHLDLRGLHFHLRPWWHLASSGSMLLQ